MKNIQQGLTTNLEVTFFCLQKQKYDNYDCHAKHVYFFLKLIVDNTKSIFHLITQSLTIETKESIVNRAHVSHNFLVAFN